MQLQDDLLKSFADAVNPEDTGESFDTTLYAEVTRIDSGIVYVKFDGSEIETPATSMVQVGVGDRVFASIKDHSVVITGNISFPSLTRVGDVYITLRSDGLVVGKLDKDNNPTDVYVLITSRDYKIVNKLGKTLAVFGETTQIGLAAGRHINLTSAGVELLNGDKSLAKFSDSLISLANGLAQFSSKLIKLGNTSDAQIQLCDGNGVISYASNKFKMEGGASTQVVGISNSYGNHKAELLSEAKSNSQRAGIQVLNGTSTVASVIASSSGVNCTVPNNTALTENGVEVVKVNGVIATGGVYIYTASHYGDVNYTDTFNKTIEISNIPTGYSLIGLCGFQSAPRSGYGDVTTYGGWYLADYWVTGRNKIYFEAHGVSDNIDFLSSGKPYIHATPLPDHFWLRWYAIRTSGVKTTPDQSIDGR